MSTTVRDPAVAGAFYPADPGALRSKISSFLDRAEPPVRPERVYGIIAPHAGYDYSGPAAAYAYKLIQGKNYDRVIVFALSHRVAFSGVSIFNGSAYRTPLGEIPLDQPLIDKLRSESSLCRYEPRAHAMEHSLEVQLPFLQTVLGDFKLVPILTRSQNLELCRRIAEDVFAVIPEDERDRTLVVGSADLYHGESLSECREKDERLAGAFEKFNEELIQELEAQGRIMTCGPASIKASMILCRLLGAKKASKLCLTNSAEVTGARSGYVVGYLAGAFH